MLFRKLDRQAEYRASLDSLLRETGGTPPTKHDAASDHARIGELAYRATSELLSAEGLSWQALTADEKAQVLVYSLVLCDAWSQLLKQPQEPAFFITCMHLSLLLFQPNSDKNIEASALVNVLLRQRAVVAAERLHATLPTFTPSLGSLAMALVTDPGGRERTLKALHSGFRVVLAHA